MDWSYIAGLFDGEGSVEISRSMNHGGRYGVKYHIIFGACISGTDLKSLRIISSWLNGQGISSYINSRPNITPVNGGNTRPLHRLRVTQLEPLRIFLQSTEPYLVMKKKHCRIMQTALRERDKLVRDGRPIMRNVRRFNRYRMALHRLSVKGPTHIKVW